MKKLFLTLACLTVTAGVALAQTQTMSFNDNNGTADAGTYLSTDTIVLSISITYGPYSSIGQSWWLEAPTTSGFNLAISVTGRAYTAPFSDFNQTTPNPAPFTSAAGATSGYNTEDRDLGSSTSDFQPVAAGTYSLGTVTLSLAGAPAGTYVLHTTTVTPHISVTSEGDFTTTHPIPAANYTITVSAIPEPATWSLIGLGGLGALGLNVLRARRRSS